MDRHVTTAVPHELGNDAINSIVVPPQTGETGGLLSQVSGNPFFTAVSFPVREMDLFAKNGRV